MKHRFAALLVVLLTVSCSTNPATGKREFNIVSEQQEVAMGREAHPEIVRQFGVYDEKPELNQLVERIGRRLAATSDRPNLPWTFTLLDTPMVNAMALPGGYIYITRGMIERINSEDELAGVLGHEIAHVTARHSAQQISRQQLAQFGMVLGAVVAGPQVLQQYGQFAELGLALLFQRYSRAQETQADLIGTRYMSLSAYNPVGSERMLMTLQRMSGGESSSIDRYFMSHPDPAKRVRDVRSEIENLRKDNPAITATEPQRAAFVQRLDGIVTGNSTENIVIRDGTVYDRGHGMIIQVPRGWKAQVAPGTLFVLAPDSANANMQLVAQEVEASQLQGSDGQNAVRNRLQQMGLSYLGSREASTRSNQRFTIDVWQGQTQSGPVGVETTQFVHGDHVAVFMLVAPSVRRDQSPLGDLLDATTIDRARANAARPPRMKIGTVRQGESWADLARRATGNAADAKEVANINGYDLNTPPPRGLVAKLPEEVVKE